MKVLIVLVLIFALAFASEEKISRCTQEEANLKVTKKNCFDAAASARSARATYVKLDKEFKSAESVYQTAVASHKVALDEFKHSEREQHAAAEALKVARKAEDNFCNKLVRNVNPKTPCAKLLNKARKNNRLSQCRDAKKRLTEAENRFAQKDATMKRLHQVLLQRQTTMIAKHKLRDQASDRRKIAKGKYDTLFRLKNDACRRYKEARLVHYGRTLKCDAIDKNFCYKALVPKTPVTWKQAESACKIRGGHLLSIHNDRENEISDRLCKKFTNIVPIGLYDYSGKNQFKWSDGSKVDYKRWADGEPNQYNGGEPYGEEYLSNIGNSKVVNRWNDIKTRGFKCFVCKIVNNGSKVFKQKRN